MSDCATCKHRMDSTDDAPCQACVDNSQWENDIGHAGASALDTQVGGAHYKNMLIQPVEYIHKNGIGFVEGAVIKYVSRWRSKNGVEDLKKARHMLDLLIEMEGEA